jgi:hypothetical protein
VVAWGLQLLLDQYCTGNSEAIQESLSVFFEMLEGNSESQVHAFTLLFNLAVHINLMSEHLPRLEGEAGLPESAPVPSASQIEASMHPTHTCMLTHLQHASDGACGHRR